MMPAFRVRVVTSFFAMTTFMVIATIADAELIPIPLAGSTATVTGTLYSPSATDLFDVSQGSAVVSSSPTYGNPDGFLGGEGFFEGQKNTLFGDGSVAGTIKTLVFSLTGPVSVNSISMGLSQDGGTKLRGAAGYSLFGLESPTDTGIVLSTATLANDYESAYGNTNITIQDFFPTFTGRYFRLELVQRENYYGPRVQELDGFLAPVPEPSTWALGLMGIACGGWVAWRKRKRSPVNRSLVTAASCLTLALAGIVPARAVTIDMVTVGDAGNVADTTGYGAVGYEYRIGKYEVTIGQYTDFLNAVAKSDPHYLYDASMASDLNTAGISRTGTSGGYTYSVIDNGGSSGNRPIANISWFCAARFANWMHNGQGSGSTETGAYTLNGDFYGTAPGKNFGATFYIPTEDEWYKAAYYSPTLNSGAGGYYTYATQSDTAPGNVVGSVANHANYTVDGIYSVTQSYWSSVSRNCLNDVGAFTNSASYYGTFDQSGNLEEWNDLAGASGSSRGWRGGSWGHGHASYLASSTRSAYDPAFDYPLIGFRLAAPVAVPEPSTWLLGLAGVAYALTLRRSRRAA